MTINGKEIHDAETSVLEDLDESGVLIDREYVSLTWGGNYDIRLSRIQTENDLLKWGVQLGHKNWMTANRMRHFVEAVMDAKGWEKYGLK